MKAQPKFSGARKFLARVYALCCSTWKRPCVTCVTVERQLNTSIIVLGFAKSCHVFHSDVLYVKQSKTRVLNLKKNKEQLFLTLDYVGILKRYSCFFFGGFKSISLTSEYQVQKRFLLPQFKRKEAKWYSHLVFYIHIVSTDILSNLLQVHFNLLLKLGISNRSLIKSMCVGCSHSPFHREEIFHNN